MSPMLGDALAGISTLPFLARTRDVGEISAFGERGPVWTQQTYLHRLSRESDDTGFRGPVVLPHESPTSALMVTVCDDLVEILENDGDDSVLGDMVWPRRVRDYDRVHRPFIPPPRPSGLPAWSTREEEQATSTCSNYRPKGNHSGKDENVHLVDTRLSFPPYHVSDDNKIQGSQSRSALTKDGSSDEMECLTSKLEIDDLNTISAPDQDTFDNDSGSKSDGYWDGPNSPANELEKGTAVFAKHYYELLADSGSSVCSEIDDHDQSMKTDDFSSGMANESRGTDSFKVDIGANEDELINDNCNATSEPECGAKLDSLDIYTLSDSLQENPVKLNEADLTFTRQSRHLDLSLDSHAETCSVSEECYSLFNCHQDETEWSLLEIFPEETSTTELQLPDNRYSSNGIVCQTNSEAQQTPFPVTEASDSGTCSEMDVLDVVENVREKLDHISPYSNQNASQDVLSNTNGCLPFDNMVSQSFPIEVRTTFGEGPSELNDSTPWKHWKLNEVSTGGTTTENGIYDSYGCDLNDKTTQCSAKVADISADLKESYEDTPCSEQNLSVCCGNIYDLSLPSPYNKPANPGVFNRDKQGNLNKHVTEKISIQTEDIVRAKSLKKLRRESIKVDFAERNIGLQDTELMPLMSYPDNFSAHMEEKLSRDGLYDIRKPVDSSQLNLFANYKIADECFSNEQDTDGAGDICSDRRSCNYPACPAVSDEVCLNSDNQLIMTVRMCSDRNGQLGKVTDFLYKGNSNVGQSPRAITPAISDERWQHTEATSTGEPSIYDEYPVYDTDDEGPRRRMTRSYNERKLKTLGRYRLIDKICQLASGENKQSNPHTQLRIFRGNPIC